MDGKGKAIKVGGQLCGGIVEVLQRVLVLAADALLIVFAGIAMSQDWGHECDENLHAYGVMCVLLCFLDLGWETVRCSLDSSLDRLQQDFKPEGATPNLAGGSGNEGLLGDDPFCQGVVGSPVENRAQPEASPGRLGAIVSGPAGHGVRKEKASRRKRTSDLHFWSLVFTACVSVIFCSFAAHDEDCSEKVHSLYIYIHTFTYVYIFRLGAIVLWVCCRTVKDYEDAASNAGAFMASPTAA
jgi:hypothetical protein